MSKGSAPPAPDYTGAAQATAQGNLQNLNQQTWANRPDQNTPWGSSTWTNSTDTAAYNQAVKNWQASGADPKSRPDANSYTTWTNNVTLSPPEQSALNSQQQIQQNQSSLAQSLQGQVAHQMQNGFTAPSIDSYTNGIPKVNANFSGFNASGVGAVDQTRFNPANYTGDYHGLNQSFSSAAQQNSSFNGGPAQNTAFNTNAPGLNTSFNSGTPSLNNTFSSNSPALSTTFQSDAPAINTSFHSGANPVNQDFTSHAGSLVGSAGTAQVNTNPNAYTNGAGNVDLSAPQFNQTTADAGAKAAYSASTGLLNDQWEQDKRNLDNSLRLQGLTPGTEAYNNAMQNTLRVQAQQKDQLANQAVVTGNQLANNNYASALAGYQAHNSAQGQAFDQGIRSLTTENQALGQQFSQNLSNAQLNNASAGQQYGQDLQGFNANNAAQQQHYTQDANSFGMTNDARNQAYANSLTGFNANNAARGQQFNQDATGFSLTNEARNQGYANALNGYNATNSARNTQFSQDLSAASFNNTASNTQFQNNLSAYSTVNAANNTQYQNDLAKFNANNGSSSQALQNALSQYGAALQGQNSYNAAAGQAYNQALGTYGANQQAQQDSNSAQSQAYQQAMQQYQTAYQNAYQNYLQPLNSMNAVLTGQQVGMPQMPSFTASGYTPGSDYSGAASATGQYNSGLYAQKNANASSTMGTVGSLAMAAAMAY